MEISPTVRSGDFLERFSFGASERCYIGEEAISVLGDCEVCLGIWWLMISFWNISEAVPAGLWSPSLSDRVVELPFELLYVCHLHAKSFDET